MLQPLRVLILEDTPSDVDLVVRELQRAGYVPEWVCVETEKGFLDNIERDFDIILSDYSMPQFDGLRALELARRHGLETPFILVSGTMGEETAVAAMKLGATDYLIKDRLARLGPAVSQALEQSRLRKERVAAEEALRESEERFRQLAENIHEVFWLTDPTKNEILYVSPAYETIWGRSCAAVHADPQSWLNAIHPEDREAVRQAAKTKQTEGTYDEEYRIVRPDSSIRWIRDTAFPVRNGSGEIHRIVGVARDITERKHAEEAIRVSVQRFELFMDNLPGFAWIKDQDYRYVYANKSCRQLAMDGREWFGKTDDELWPAEIAAIYRANDQQVVQTKVPQETVETILCRGEQREAISSKFPILNGDAKVAFICGIGIDITERRRAEERLREQADIINLAQDAILIRDLDEVIQFWNKGAERLYGWTSKEAMGRSVSDLIYAGQDEFLAAKKKLTEEGEWVGEIEQRCKSGKNVIASCSWTLVRDDKGQPKSILAINTDVTERKEAEEAIRQSESRLRALLTSMDDLALEFDVEGRYIAIWTARDELLSHPRGELIGRRIADVHGEEVAQRFVSVIKRAMESKTAEDLNYAMDVITGHRQFVARISPILNMDGSCDRVCVLCRDVTEQKKLEAQFLRAQRVESIGTLASGVAHDLNNILAPIMMGAAVLGRTDMPKADLAILSTIETCAQRGADIVKQVLTFARGAEGERMVLQPAHLINDMSKIAQETFPKAINVRARFSEPVWQVESDPTHLHQVLLNLCVNARDAMPAGGALTLSVENFPVDEHYASMTPGARPGPYVLFEVSDTGMGIPRHIIDKIFDPFFTTKELGKGTGLGLSTVIGIVKSHGGFVGVYSEVGRGTIFKVFLPAKVGEAAGAEQSVATVLPPSHGELLLIVDDEKTILQVAKALLEDHGYQVLTAADAAEALALFAMRKDEIQLVLTDLAMPLMDGVALIRTLLKMDPDVKVIASTGRGGHEDHAHELAGLNVRATLTKPYNKKKLLMTLHDVLAQPLDNHSSPSAQLEAITL